MAKTFKGVIKGGERIGPNKNNQFCTKLQIKEDNNSSPWCVDLECYDNPLIFREGDEVEGLYQGIKILKIKIIKSNCGKIINHRELNEVEKMSENQTLKLSGTVLWAKVHQPVLNEDSGKEEYSATLVPDKQTLEFLKTTGVPIKNKDEEYKKEGKPLQGTFVTLKTTFKPQVVDSKLQKIPETVLIGNGSKVVIEAQLYTYKPRKKGQTGTGLGLRGVQVLDLVHYTKSSILEPEENGFDISQLGE